MELNFSKEERQRIKELCLMFNSTMLVVDGCKVIVPLARWQYEQEEQQNAILRGAV